MDDPSINFLNNSSWFDTKFITESQTTDRNKIIKDKAYSAAIGKVCKALQITTKKKCTSDKNWDCLSHNYMLRCIYYVVVSGVPSNEKITDVLISRKKFILGQHSHSRQRKQKEMIAFMLIFQSHPALSSDCRKLCLLQHSFVS